MWFKNLSLMRPPRLISAYRRPEPFENAIAQFPLRSPGPLKAMETRGFLTPFSRDASAHCSGSGDALLFCLGQESRLLHHQWRCRVRAHRRTRSQDRSQPGRRNAQRIPRNSAMGELLPRAFIKRSRHPGPWDAPSRLLAVDSGSDKASRRWPLRCAMRSAVSRRDRWPPKPRSNC